MSEDPNTPTPSAHDHADSTPEQLRQALAQFTGTERYYRYWAGLTYLTDGVKYLADATGCYWLLDLIASHQCHLAKHHDQRLQTLQFWRLKVEADRDAVLTCVADQGERPAVKEFIEWTDFPLPEIDIWVARDDEKVVALLPSEY